MTPYLKLREMERTVIMVDAGIIEDIIDEEYGFEGGESYSIGVSEETSNDVSLEILVDGEMDDYDRETVKKRSMLYSVRAYMNDLGRRGIIPMNQYVIDVSW